MSYPAPAIRSTFVGRDDDLAALSRLISRPMTHLLTITGPGGVGKTRLAQELVQRMGDPSGKRLWIVSLAHIHQAEQVIGAIAGELGSRDIDAGETLARVVDRLVGAPALLVLDNLEQVI